MFCHNFSKFLCDRTVSCVCAEMFNKIRTFFNRNKKYYDPSSTDCKQSVNEEKTRRESFRSMDPSELEEAENGKSNCSTVPETKQVNMDDFEFISPIPEERYNDVIVHLRNNFFADEPLNKSLGLCEPGESNVELEAHSLKTLQDQLSIMAIDKDTDKIAAVSLNGVQLPGDIQQGKKKLEKMTDEKFKQIFTLLYDLNESLDLFNKYNVDKLFDARILSVDSNYRGKGLGKEIMKRAEGVAKENNFQVMKGDATGMFSQKILISLGWELVHELKYAEHVDENEIQIFKPPAPHESLKIMVKVLK